MGRNLLIFEDVKREVSKVAHLLSGLAREFYETNVTPPMFLWDTLQETLKDPRIPDADSLDAKVRKLLTHLHRKTEEFGQKVELGDIETVVALAYAKSSHELQALFKLINEKKLAEIGVTERIVRIALLEKGWELVNSLTKNKESDRGFIAIWFDDQMNEAISVIEQVITESGYRPICIRDKHFPETIMEKALGEIRQSRFVVVDLTGHRVDVAFEAGFAFGLGVEAMFVYDKRKHPDTPPRGFYAGHFQCHAYGGYDELKAILKAAIGARIGARTR